MSKFKLSDVVKILIESERLITERRRFSDDLNVTPNTRDPLDLQYNNGNLKPYDYFSEMLRDWCKRNKERATVGELMSILITSEFQDSAERLWDETQSMVQPVIIVQDITVPIPQIHNGEASIPIDTITSLLSQIMKTELGTVCINVLQVLAFLSTPEISIKQLTKFYNCVNSNDQQPTEVIESAIKSLETSGLFVVGNDGLELNGLVQLAIRAEMKKANPDNSAMKANSLLSCIAIWRRQAGEHSAARSTYFKKDKVHLKKFWSNFNSKDYTELDMVHIISMWSHTISIDKLINMFPDTAVVIWERLHQLKLASESLKFAQSNSRYFSTAFPGNDKHRYGMEGCLIKSLKENGYYNESVSKGKELYEKIKLLGDDHKLVQETIQNTALILPRLNRHLEALYWKEKVLHYRQNKYRDTDPSILRAKRSMGWDEKFIWQSIGESIDDNGGWGETLKNCRHRYEGGYDSATLLEEWILTAKNNDPGRTQLQGILRTQQLLSMILYKQKRREEALDLVRDFYESRGSYPNDMIIQDIIKQMENTNWDVVNV